MIISSILKKGTTSCHVLIPLHSKEWWWWCAHVSHFRPVNSFLLGLSCTLRVFSSILILYPLEASSTPPVVTKQYLQTLPNIPQGQKPPSVDNCYQRKEFTLVYILIQFLKHTLRMTGSNQSFQVFSYIP